MITIPSSINIFEKLFNSDPNLYLHSTNWLYTRNQQIPIINIIKNISFQSLSQLTH
jgi:hypothetical protein